MTFKDLKAATWPECLALCARILANLYREHRALLPGLEKEQAADFQAVLEERATQVRLENSLFDLTVALQRQHGTAALVLLDEYDTPLHSAYANGYYAPALSFFRNLLSAALKDNRALHKGVLTGVLRVAKDSIFTGLNNLDVSSLLSRNYATAFGFTQSEVEGLLAEADLSPRLPEVQRWYNGYLFGGQVIYNPWSVLSFVKNHPDEPEPYWANTSSNDLVHEVLAAQEAPTQQEWEQLLRGETLERPIDESVALRDLKTQPQIIWSLLLFTGYLKVVSKRLVQRQLTAALTIPNEEVRSIYEKQFAALLVDSLGGDLERKSFLRALLAGDTARLEVHLSRWLLRYASHHDTAQHPQQPERFYHGLVLGLLVSLSPDYDVRSNPEAGLGRCDVLISQRKAGRPGVVLELKVANRSKRETLAGALKAAQQQLRDRAYAEPLRAAGAEPVHELAVAWLGKEVRVASAKPVRAPAKRPPRARADRR